MVLQILNMKYLLYWYTDLTETKCKKYTEICLPFLFEVKDKRQYKYFF